MKKIITVVLVVLLANSFPNHAAAQGFNLGVNFGLALPSGSSVIYESGGLSGAENNIGTYGEGIPVGITAGYMFNENFGADLSFSYLIGNKREFSESYSSPVFGTYSTTTTLNSSIVRIMPGVKVSAGNDLKLSPYGRFGVVFGVSPTITKTFEESSGDGATLEYSGGNSLGWYGAFGVGFKLNDNLTLNAELLLINQGYGAEKAVLTDNDGTTETINFADEVSTGSEDELKIYESFSSIGLNIGIMYGF
jgi:opacity protein-like surface antigen